MTYDTALVKMMDRSIERDNKLRCPKGCINDIAYDRIGQPYCMGCHMTIEVNEK